MGTGYDLRKFQKGKGAESIEDAFSRIVSGGKLGVGIIEQLLIKKHY